MLRLGNKAYDDGSSFVAESQQSLHTLWFLKGTRYGRTGKHSVFRDEPDFGETTGKLVKECVRIDRDPQTAPTLAYGEPFAISSESLCRDAYSYSNKMSEAIARTINIFLLMKVGVLKESVRDTMCLHFQICLQLFTPDKAACDCDITLCQSPVGHAQSAVESSNGTWCKGKAQNVACTCRNGSECRTFGRAVGANVIFQVDKLNITEQLRLFMAPDRRYQARQNGKKEHVLDLSDLKDVGIAIREQRQCGSGRGGHQGMKSMSSSNTGHPARSAWLTVAFICVSLCQRPFHLYSCGISNKKASSPLQLR